MRVGSDRAVRVLWGLTWVLGATLVVLSAWVVVARIVYPIDAEWMTGAIRDGVERVQDGKPLYGPPDAHFIPFVYPPLYFWLAGLLARALGSFAACKVVSIGGTLAAGWAVHRIAKTLGARAPWSRVAVLLFVATYPLTLLFYDLERVDGLYAGLSMVSLALLFSSESTRATAIAGALLGLSFYAKQAGLMMFGAAVIGLFVAGERKRARIVLASGAVVLAVVFVVLEATTHGWFRYYCIHLPSAHGIRAQRLTTFFIQDAPKAFAFTAASVALVAGVIVSLIRERKKPDAMTWQSVVLGAVVGASMIAAFSFRAHSGGWANVLVAWLPLACPAFAILATRMESWSEGAATEHVMSLALLSAVSLQLLGAMFDPMELAPTAADLRDHEQLVSAVRALEKEGDVLVLPSGHVTKTSSAHAAALYDVLRAGDHAPADLLEGLKSRHFVAIIVDIPVDCDFAQCHELEVALARNYFVAARRHEREHTGMIGYDARPRWTFRPRQTPLDGLTKEDLFLRQRVEKSLATIVEEGWPAGTDPRPTPAIELQAAQATASPAL